MISGFISGIIIAWCLTLFDVDDFINDFSKEHFDKEISETTYYMIFGILGLICGIFKINIF